MRLQLEIPERRTIEMADHLLDLRPLLDAILSEYTLPLGGDHGVAHWARVLENGL